MVPLAAAYWRLRESRRHPVWAWLKVQYGPPTLTCANSDRLSGVLHTRDGLVFADVWVSGALVLRCVQRGRVSCDSLRHSGEASVGYPTEAWYLRLYKLALGADRRSRGFAHSTKGEYGPQSGGFGSGL